ncbi:hypothetical protein [Methanospirillum hungatei]|uniref:hypothetical protein n=1 Tax=Methanospirillum hungatei TaxID=2203 RepID=UPI0026E99EEB|nr:hypothetical protein [Methanospirillum hungatei]MCA1915142.1 hypothetical protein [Methanospirillum hungatei]
MSNTTTSVPHGSCIPWQMQREDLLYVMVPAGEKGPTYKGWNLVSQGRRHDDPILAVHLLHGGNYGYYPAPCSDLLSLDVDDADTFHGAGGKDLVRETFRYSAWPDRRKYRAIISCPDIPDHYRGHKLPIRSDRDQTIVELFFPAGLEKTGGQCIGPLSLHPNGNRYEIYDPDASIMTVRWSEIEEITRIICPAIADSIPEPDYRAPVQSRGKTITERYGLSVMDTLPRDARIAGSEIRGVHPVHGSTSPGGNVAMNPKKGVVYCFRCAAGYDAAGWDAICRGIMPCGGTYDSAVMKQHLEVLNREKPEVRFLERIAWKRSRRRS